MAIEQQLDALRQEVLQAIDAAQTSAALEDVRVGVLGKKGSLTAILRDMKSLAPEERPIVGKISNEVRDADRSRA